MPRLARDHVQDSDETDPSMWAELSGEEDRPNGTEQEDEPGNEQDDDTEAEDHCGDDISVPTEQVLRLMVSDGQENEAELVLDANGMATIETAAELDDEEDVF